MQHGTVSGTERTVRPVTANATHSDWDIAAQTGLMSELKQLMSNIRDNAQENETFALAGY